MSLSSHNDSNIFGKSYSLYKKHMIYSSKDATNKRNHYSKLFVKSQLNYFFVPFKWELQIGFVQIQKNKETDSVVLKLKTWKESLERGR